MSLRVRFEITGPAGAPWLSTMNFQGTTLTNAQDSADAVRAFWLALQGSIVDTATGRVLPEVLIINDVTGEPTGIFSITPGDPITFTASNTLLPRTTQALVRWRTGVYSNGREIRGRTFIPGLTQVANNQGRPASGITSTLTTAANALISDVDSVFGVYSKRNGALAVVNAASVWNEFAELRTRRD